MALRQIQKNISSVDEPTKATNSRPKRFLTSNSENTNKETPSWLKIFDNDRNESVLYKPKELTISHLNSCGCKTNENDKENHKCSQKIFSTKPNEQDYATAPPVIQPLQKPKIKSTIQITKIVKEKPQTVEPENATVPSVTTDKPKTRSSIQITKIIKENKGQLEEEKEPILKRKLEDESLLQIKQSKVTRFKIFENEPETIEDQTESKQNLKSLSSILDDEYEFKVEKNKKKSTKTVNRSTLKSVDDLLNKISTNGGKSSMKDDEDYAVAAKPKKMSRSNKKNEEKRRRDQMLNEQLEAEFKEMAKEMKEISEYKLIVETVHTDY